MIALLHLVALGLYSAAAAMLGVSLARGSRRLPRTATIVVGIAAAVHVWALVEYTSVWRELPLVGLGPCLSSIALLISLGSLLATAFWNVGAVGLVLVPVAALLIGVATAVGIEPAGEAVAFRGPWFVLHVVFAFIGYAGLTLAFAGGLMYLLQFRELKSKHFGAIFRFFPPLDTLDRLSQRGLLVGFPFLTMALILGWAWTERFGAEAARNSEVIWGVLTWVVFVLALGARRGGGRQGHRGALASVVGFAVVVLAYVVLRAGGGAGSFL